MNRKSEKWPRSYLSKQSPSQEMEEIDPYAKIEERSCL